MRVQLFGKVIVPEWIAADPRYASFLAVLAPLWDDPRVVSRVVCDPDVEVLSIDVYGLLEESSWSSVERLIVHTAVGLYGAAVSDAGDSLGLLVETLDDDTLDRVLEAVAIRRGRILAPANILQALVAARAVAPPDREPPLICCCRPVAVNPLCPTHGDDARCPR